MATMCTEIIIFKAKLCVKKEMLSLTFISHLFITVEAYILPFNLFVTEIVVNVGLIHVVFLFTDH